MRDCNRSIQRSKRRGTINGPEQPGVHDLTRESDNDTHHEDEDEDDDDDDDYQVGDG